MRWLWVVGGCILAVIGAMLIFGACQKNAVRASLARSTAPLLVPADPWRAAFDFTAPPGATDLYSFRWNFGVGATDSVAGWQVGPAAMYEAPRLTEAPGEKEVAEVLRAATDPDCAVVDAQSEIRLCSYPAEFELGGVSANLVRSITAGGVTQTLVVTYVNRGADRSSYNPESLEARYLAASFDPMPIDGDIGDYLVYIY
jgi:hypothetical protein